MQTQQIPAYGVKLLWYPVSVFPKKCTTDSNRSSILAWVKALWMCRQPLNKGSTQGKERRNRRWGQRCLILLQWGVSMALCIGTWSGTGGQQSSGCCGHPCVRYNRNPSVLVLKWALAALYHEERQWQGAPAWPQCVNKQGRLPEGAILQLRPRGRSHTQRAGLQPPQQSPFHTS